MIKWYAYIAFKSQIAYNGTIMVYDDLSILRMIGIKSRNIQQKHHECRLLTAVARRSRHRSIIRWSKRTKTDTLRISEPKNLIPTNLFKDGE